MNRVIKFRIWDSAKHCMYQNVGIVPCEIDYLRPTLMQFTGLLDKNGKEIYEGDIVADDRWGGKLFEVRWCNGKNEFLSGQVGWVLDDEKFSPVGHIVNEFAATTELHDREDYYNGIVVGNVYENSKLITHGDRS